MSLTSDNIAFNAAGRQADPYGTEGEFYFLDRPTHNIENGVYKRSAVNLETILNLWEIY